jgi:hypothetical protein
MGNVVSSLALGALADPGLATYAFALDRACESSPPPYGESWFGKEYRRVTRDPSWFASLMVSDVDLEGYSATQLWSYADALGGADFADGLRRHALDEARHSKMFAALLFTIFPQLRSDELTAKLRDKSPDLRPSTSTVLDAPHAGRPFEEVLNSAILINLHEVKALVLEQLLRPVLLAYATPDTVQRVARIADAIISDEVRHIRYSAQFVESAARRGYRDYVIDAIADFQQTVNFVTIDEVESTVRHARRVHNVLDAEIG